MRQQQRRESARGWIGSGATVTIKTYARRYGVDRYTAYEDLTALGFPLPASAQHWAQRPPPTPRPGRTATTDTSPLHSDWIMMDGRPFFVAGYTAGGFPTASSKTRCTTTTTTTTTMTPCPFPTATSSARNTTPRDRSPAASTYRDAAGHPPHCPLCHVRMGLTPRAR